MNLLLIAHIGGAIAISFAIFVSLWSLPKSKQTLHKQLFVSLGIGSMIQTITGSLLAVSSEGTIASYCAKMGLYLSAIFVTELLLLRKLQDSSSLESTKRLFVYITINTVLVFVTVVSLTYYA